MNLMTNVQRDSHFFDCLFRYLDYHKIKVRNVRVIKTHVIMLDIGKEILVLKKFNSSKNLKSQMKLMKKLKEYSFTQAYEFYEPLPIFHYNGKEFVFQKYIQPSRDFFHFQTITNREQGLKLLSNLHSCTKQILMECPNEFNLAYYDQIEKWEDRSLEFQQNMQIIQKYTSLDVIQTYWEIANFSIDGMKKTNHNNGENSIIHGDVAYHNFIRDHSGKLRLIDFDLMAIAPPMVDYLQYANRILPSCQFDIKKLMSHTIIAKQLENPYFLYALLYPTDIFREWNRLLRDRYLLPERIYDLKEMTENNFLKRIKFSNQIKTMIK